MATQDSIEKSQLLLWRRWFISKRFQLFVDSVLLISAFVFSYFLRFDFDIPRDDLHRLTLQLPYVVLLQVAVVLRSGVYRFIWRYIGMGEVKAFIKAALISSALLIVLRFGLPESLFTWRVPLSVILMDTFLAFGGLVGIRVLRRAVYERSENRQKEARLGGDRKKPVLLIGAGRAGMLTAKEIQSNGSTNLEVIGFVDDDPNKLKSTIVGIKVLGKTDDLPRLIKEHEIDHVIISIAQGTRKDFRRILDICERSSVKARVIPGLYEILQGRVTVSRIRDIQIEDLLGRQPVELDLGDLDRLLGKKVVMVTGAGGSIGSELARQVIRFNPAKLLLVERAEFALFNIERELNTKQTQIPILPLLADIGDANRMRSIFETYRPDVIIHAAAHKHVPMMESNPTEAVKNNIIATRLIGNLAGEFQAEAFVLISTDKAVRPTSIMGAAKRVAELIVQDLQHRHATRYVAVRFGNVIGSAGSVIPIFREQIRKGGPVTVTHPDMIRYFMTIPEAAQLVLQAASMGAGGEIFILDMGEPVRIFDLAKDTIILSGLKPYEDIDIIFTGIRPGEKLYEELEMAGEDMSKTRHPKIFVGRIAAYPEEMVEEAVKKLSQLSVSSQAEEGIRVFLNTLLPEARLFPNRDNNQANVRPEMDQSLTVGAGAQQGAT